MKATINKAKIVKGKALEISFDETKAGNVKVPVNETWKEPWHQDLQTAFDGLRIHAGVLLEYIAPSAVDDLDDFTEVDEKLVESIHVTSFSIGGSDETQGVTISGHRLTGRGKAVIFNTPFERFTQNEETRYVFMDELTDSLALIQEELVKYMEGTKRGTEQGKLNFPKEEHVTKAKIATEEKSLFNQVGGGLTEVYIEGQEKPVSAAKIPPADPDAMKRVAAMGTDHEEAVAKETNEHPTPTKAAKKAAVKKVKKVPQSAAAPGGVVEEPAE